MALTHRITVAVGLVVALGMVAPLPAWAVDHPIDGMKLLLEHSHGREKLAFVSKDPSFLWYLRLGERRGGKQRNRATPT